MNVITSQTAIQPSGENITGVIGSIVDELAKLIIMIETGRRHFVAGLRVANPEPFFVKTMEFCSINMYVNNAKLIVLVPTSVDFNNCIALLIGRVNNILHDLDAAISAVDTMFKEENAFAFTRSEYVRTVDSLIMPKSATNQVMKRVFKVWDGSRSTVLNTAFQWDISKNIQQFPGTSMPNRLHPEAIWFADKTDIYVNLVGASISRFSSHEQLRSISSVLQHFGVKKIIQYQRNRKTFMREDEKQEEFKYPTVTWNGATYSIRITHITNNSSLIDDTCMYINWKPRMSEPADASATHLVPVAMTGNDFFSEFMESKHEFGASVDLCQMCHKRQCDIRMYALSKNTANGLDPFSRGSDEYAVICGKCMCNDPAFIDISQSIKIVAYYPKTQWSDVCEDHGFPRKHALLFESDSFQNTHKMYSRDETLIAFASPVVTLTILQAIEKFMLEVPNGEFLVFN